MRYVHTNLVARDWRRLARFYERAFGCVYAGPERDLRGAWLARGTGGPCDALRGVHLRLPGWGDAGPTLEIFEYSEVMPRDPPRANWQGYGHIAFAVQDVAAQVAIAIREGGAALGEVVRHAIPGVGELAFAYVRDPEGNVIEIQSRAGERGRERRREPGALAPLDGLALEAGYDRWAATYDRARNLTRDVAAAVLRRAIAQRELAGLDVIELGCGTGGNTQALIAARRVLALDLSAGMLARARAKISAAAAPRVVFARCDIRAPLPCADAAFDLAVVTLVLEHAADLGPIMSAMHRALRPGGRAVVIEFHPYRQLRGKQARFDDPDTGAAIPIAAHVHTIAEYVGAARAAGFAIAGLGEWRESIDSGAADADSESESEAGEAGDAVDAARQAGPGDAPRVLSLELAR